MSNINAQGFMEAKARAFGTDADGERFQEAFNFALKSTLADLRILCNISVTTPTDYTGTIGLDEDYYLPVLGAGIDRYIDTFGDWMRKPEGNLIAIYEDARKTAAMYNLRDVEDTSTEARLGNLTD